MEGGSKLSKLQRWILTHAHKNRVAEHRDLGADGADLFYGQVLAGFYQFPRTAPWEIWEPCKRPAPSRRPSRLARSVRPNTTPLMPLFLALWNASDNAG